MKIAILLVGNIRTWELTKSNFFQSFGHLAPDIFLTTYNSQYGYHPHIQGRIGDNTDEWLSFEQIHNMFKGIATDFNIRQYMTDADRQRLHDKFKHLDNCVGQVLGLDDAVQMMQRREEIGFRYDVVIKTRCDLLYNPIQLDFNPNKIIIDSGNVYPNDCVVITSRDNMVRIRDIVVEEIYNPKHEDSHVNAPHGLLNCAIRETGLQVDAQGIMHGVLRKSGEVHYY